MADDKPRRVVITGTSRGLGRAMAELLICLGHIVHGCGRSRASQAEMARRCGRPHTFHAVDVSRDEQVAGWAEEVLKEGVPDLLINNAALINGNAVLWKVPAKEFDDVLAVNLSGVANCIRHFVPAMVHMQKGVVVNFSSGWGRSTSPEVAPYCATKWAIEGLTQALAQELPDGMAAVPLNPGIIDTDMLRSTFGGGAGSYPSAEAWAKRSVPYLLALGKKHNGRPLSVPD